MDKFHPTPGMLRNLYCKKRLSLRKIAKMFGLDFYKMRHEFVRNNIKIRRPVNEIIYPKRNFSGNVCERAYMLGLRTGDIHARKAYNFIRVESTTTHPEFVNMFKLVFGKYSHVGAHLRYNKDHNEWVVYCDLDESFEFLIKKPEEVPKEILYDDKLFFYFLAGYMDSEGSWTITKSNEDDIRFMFRIRTYDKVILAQLRNRLVDLGFLAHFYLDRRMGESTTFGKLRKDFFGIRIYREKQIIDIIHLLLPLSHHLEKIRIMKLVLESSGKKWSEVKEQLLTLRKDIKKGRPSTSKELPS